MVSARTARNHRSADACFQWAFSSLQHSPGAYAYYLAHRSRGQSHFRAVYALANRWVGILRGCLASGTTYEEGVGWPSAIHTADRCGLPARTALLPRFASEGLA
jgi:hypothetical protein